VLYCWTLIVTGAANSPAANRKSFMDILPVRFSGLKTACLGSL
jgi:hypothetical protein